jgi:hypothetical protein
VAAILISPLMRAYDLVNEPGLSAYALQQIA